jgi:aminoglycoside 3-N-acetyltransferase
MTVKQFVSYIVYFLPKFIAEPLGKYHQKKQLNIMKKRHRRVKVEKEEIVAIINNLDINSDVFLHSSTVSIGKIAIGIKKLCILLLEKVDIEKNTLLISALPFRGRSKDFLDEGNIFDVRNAPVEMGAINEYFLTYKDSVRSMHPTHSVIAIGPKAYCYVSEHHLDITPFGKHSPYYKLIKNNAKILMFGAHLEYLTFVHVISDMLGKYFPVNEYLKKIYTVKVIDYLGNAHAVRTLCHDPFKSIKRDALRLLPYFIRYNAIDRYVIGESEILLLNAKKVTYAYFMALLDGVSIFGKFNLNKETEEKILEEIEFLDLG